MAAVEYMANDVVWTNQASSAAGVDKRCPSVLARVWWYSVSPTRVVAAQSEKMSWPGRHVDYGQCVGLEPVTERVGWRI